jgi:hypothetical protein
MIDRVDGEMEALPLHDPELIEFPNTTPPILVKIRQIGDRGFTGFEGEPGVYTFAPVRAPARACSFAANQARTPGRVR